MTKHSIFTLLFVFLFPFVGSTQDQENTDNPIKVYVSKEHNPILFFANDIQNKSVVCGDDNYDIPIDGKKITISPGKKSPKSPCTLIMEEGKTPKKTTQRIITIIYSEKGDFEPYYDLSSEEKINAIIVKQNRNKKSGEEKSEGKEKAKSDVVKQDDKVGKPKEKATETETENADDLTDDFNTPEMKEEVTKSIIKLIEQFGRFLTNIANSNESDANRFIQRVINEHFNNCDSCQVQVISHKGAPSETFTIKRYLGKVKLYKWPKVTITVDHVDIVGGITKDEITGDYFCNAVFQQKFEAYNSLDSKTIRYTDITQKTAQIRIKVWVSSEEGKMKTHWKTYLTDIKADKIE